MKVLRNGIIGKDEKTEIGGIWMISGDYNIINKSYYNFRENLFMIYLFYKK